MYASSGFGFDGYKQYKDIRDTNPEIAELVVYPNPNIIPHKSILLFNPREETHINIRVCFLSLYHSSMHSYKSTTCSQVITNVARNEITKRLVKWICSCCCISYTHCKIIRLYKDFNAHMYIQQNVLKRFYTFYTWITCYMCINGFICVC